MAYGLRIGALRRASSVEGNAIKVLGCKFTALDNSEPVGLQNLLVRSPMRSRVLEVNFLVKTPSQDVPN